MVVVAEAFKHSHYFLVFFSLVFNLSLIVLSFTIDILISSNEARNTNKKIYHIKGEIYNGKSIFRAN